AGIAALFGSKLLSKGEPGAEYITPLVFMIVLGTVLLNATTARFVAKIVGVFLKKSEGVLIIGASKVSRLIGNYLKKNNRHVVLIDNNQSNIEKAQRLGLEAMTADIFSDSLADNIELNDMGFLLALTGNSDINEFAIEKFQRQFGENGAFRLVNSDEMNDPDNNPKEGLFSHTDDFIKLIEVVRKYPAIQEIDLKDKQHYDDLIDLAQKDSEIIPVFTKAPTGVIDVIPANSKDFSPNGKGYKLVYMGKTIVAD
ncbi:MAG: NAD-binding protein, partial [Allomuricauda sp.]